ncbi:amino acid adenylation domain-containing protein [Candidatus Bipolaricaulota bacterium]
MGERGSDSYSEERHADATTLLQEQLAVRKARLNPAQTREFEERIRGTQDAASLGGIRRQPMDATKPLSFSQERLWFLQQLDPEDRSHIRPVAVRLTGELNVALLEESLAEISRRHEVLRATFDAAEGYPQQRIAAVRPIKLRVVDCSTLPAADRDSRTRAILKEGTRELFDLGAGPILRGALVRSGMREHVLLLVTHHIVFDAWSCEILIDELFTVYGQLTRGSQPDVPALPITYADYAHWQNQRFEAGLFDESLAYWTDALRDLPDRVELPTDQPRRSIQADDGDCERLRLCPDLVRDLESLARTEGATLFNVLLAAFAVLIQRYTGLEDFLVGTPVSGRGEIETEVLIGSFVNTLVIRCDLSGDPTSCELVGRIRETVLHALEHQHVPFEKVVEAVHPDRELGLAPLFDVMFNLENIPRRSASSPGLTIEPYEIDVLAVGTDLAAEIRNEADSGLTCEFSYRSDLFDRETIQRALAHYEILLGGMAQDANRPISEIPMLPAAERHRLLVEWNDTQRAYPEDCCIHELFDAQVERTPGRIAVVCGDESLTYRELANRVASLVEQLRRRGVRRNVPVGIRLERSINLLVSIFAVLKAGGAYVPFDLTIPRERATFMLEDAAVRCLITQQSLDSDLSSWKGERIVVDVQRQVEPPVKHDAPVRSLPEDTACIIYTSGSTGKPKGVMLTHRGVVNHLVGTYAALGIRLDDVILQIPSVGFDASLLSLIGPPIHGVRVVLLSELQVRDPLEIVSTMQAGNLTVVLNTVPSLLSALVDTVSAQRARIPSLRFIGVGGEVLSGNLAQRTLATFGRQIPLYNLYGPTEGTGVATIYRIADVPSDQTSIPIGSPLPNVSVYVVDRSLEPTGIGIPGEICLAGPGVAKGYINHPKLTAERFVQNPFDSDTLLYKTGDRGRWLASGELEFLGRMDRQIKLRGYRIELGEIESALCQHPAVRQAVVEIYEPVPNERQLTAYVVRDVASETVITSLREHLRGLLPHSMIPSQFIVLDALPLTVRGKVDRAALPRPSGSHRAVIEPFVEPRTPSEVSIAEIWRKILNVDRIGVHDDFFELGGHSLLAVRVSSRIEETLSVRVPIRILFDRPTIAGVAAFIDGGPAEEEAP